MESAAPMTVDGLADEPVMTQSVSTMDDAPVRSDVANGVDGDNLVWWAGGIALLGIAGLGAGALMMRRPDDSARSLAGSNARARMAPDQRVRAEIRQAPVQIPAAAKRVSTQTDAMAGTAWVPTERVENAGAPDRSSPDGERDSNKPIMPAQVRSIRDVSSDLAVAGGRIIGRHERAALIGPSENNPFLTRKNRVRRARFYDRQEAMAALSRKPAYGVMDRVRSSPAAGHPAPGKAPAGHVIQR